MKNVLFINPYLLMLGLLISQSCISSNPFPPVIGNGTQVDKTFNVSDFNGIDVSSGFDVILVQGNTERVTVTAQENLLEHIIVAVEQGVLKVYTEKNIMPTKSMKARIEFKSIERLKVSGGGDVTCETTVDVPKLDMNISGGGDLSSEINTGELQCRMSGGGDADINGNIKDYNITMSGGGDLESIIEAHIIYCNLSGGGDLSFRNKGKADDAHIIISGGGDITLNMDVEQLKCSVSGGGDAGLKGQAASLELDISGGGDVSAESFISANASIQASGGSDIHVNVTNTLTGNISGGGDVYYSGNPENVSIDAKGGSKIYKQ